MEALSLIGDLGLNVVDEKEIARCKAMFTLYDEDKDGKLTYAELLTCVRCCGRNPSVDEFKRRALTNSSGSTVLEPARAILDATGTGELREFAPMPPPGRPSPPGRPRSREHSFAD